MAAFQSLPGHFGHVTSRFNGLRSACLPPRAQGPDLSVLKPSLNGFVTNGYRKLCKEAEIDRENICEDSDNILFSDEDDGAIERDVKRRSNAEETPTFKCTGVSGIRTVIRNKNNGRRNCICSRDYSPLRQPVIFYEQLETPLVFVLKTESRRYDSESNTLDSDSWITEIDSECDGLTTPPSDSDCNCEFDDCSVDGMDGSDDTMAGHFREDTPEVSPLSSPLSPDDDVMIVDSNHNNTKMLSTDVFPFPVHGAYEHSTHGAQHHLHAHAHKLTTVRESVSELEETSDVPTKTPIIDDPFVRRLNCLPPNPNLNLVLTNPEGETLELSPFSEHGSPTVPAHVYGRSRLGAASGSYEDTPIVTWSPTLSPRRSRKIGKCLDIEEVKELTSRLNLQTRRPSVHAWKQKHFSGERPKFTDDVTIAAEDKQEPDVRWSPDFRDRINGSLEWIKSELSAMREQDALLARQLLNIRKGMYKLKLERSTFNHQLILDEAMDVEEERDELHRNRDCDLTPDLFSPTLKHMGVTRMNLNCRRFSVF